MSRIVEIIRKLYEKRDHDEEWQMFYHAKENHALYHYYKGRASATIDVINILKEIRAPIVSNGDNKNE